METETIKLKKDEFTNIQHRFKDYDIILLNGARTVGKSYPTAHEIGEMLKNDLDCKFIYMRISEKELHTYASWCSDLDLKSITGCELNKLERGTPTRGDIKLSGFGEDGTTVVYERIIGKCVSLETSAEFKSGKYDEVVAIVFEEYTRKDMHINNEKRYVFNFLENVTSFFRNRPKKVFCIGNSLKSLPLLETAIRETEGTIFKNPIKFKIFKEIENTNNNKFLEYLTGEQYDEEDFKIRIEEFRLIYVNSEFKIYNHLVYDNKYYVTFNNNNDKIKLKKENFLKLKYFCIKSSNNEFYYKSNKVEYDFTNKYFKILEEITNIVATQGFKYL